MKLSCGTQRMVRIHTLVSYTSYKYWIDNTETDLTDMDCEDMNWNEVIQNRHYNGLSEWQ